MGEGVEGKGIAVWKERKRSGGVGGGIEGESREVEEGRVVEI